ncbi:hypothetical protein BaRGS_00038565 [Batillaria attramentaria]|uniref:Uncharacterized protein n=1 Tax=Batillaria attramentaria TaxID=370345 RepID=A0ABD0J6Y2_9CAEN
MVSSEARLQLLIMMVFAMLHMRNGQAQGEDCIPKRTTVVKWAWKRTESPPGCDDKCQPMNPETVCTTNKDRDRCWQAMTVDDVLEMYDLCYSHGPTGEKCSHLLSKFQGYKTECLKGVVRDPCEDWDDLGVTTLSLLRTWNPGGPQNLQCTCSIQSSEGQLYQFTGLNVYSTNGVTLDDPLTLKIVTATHPGFDFKLAARPSRHAGTFQSFSAVFGALQVDTAVARQILTVNGLITTTLFGLRKTAWILVGSAGGTAFVVLVFIVASVLCKRNKNRQSGRFVPEELNEMTTNTRVVPEDQDHYSRVADRNTAATSHIYMEIDQNLIPDWSPGKLEDVATPPETHRGQSGHPDTIPVHIETDSDGYLLPFTRRT